MIHTRQVDVLTRVGIVSLAILLASTVGCLNSSDDNVPMSARITLAGTAASPLQLVVSTDFFEQIVNEGTEILVVLRTADTMTVSPPFDQTVALSELGIVLVRLIQPDSTPTTATMEVRLDGQLEYSQEATLSQGAFLEYRFIFSPLF